MLTPVFFIIMVIMLGMFVICFPLGVILWLFGFTFGTIGKLVWFMTKYASAAVALTVYFLKKGEKEKIIKISLPVLAVEFAVIAVIFTLNPKPKLDKLGRANSISISSYEYVDDFSGEGWELALTNTTDDMTYLEDIYRTVENTPLKRTFKETVDLEKFGYKYIVDIYDEKGNTLSQLIVTKGLVIEKDGSTTRYYKLKNKDDKIPFDSFSRLRFNRRYDRDKIIWEDYIMAIQNTIKYTDGFITFEFPQDIRDNFYLNIERYSPFKTDKAKGSYLYRYTAKDFGAGDKWKTGITYRLDTSEAPYNKYRFVFTGGSYRYTYDALELLPDEYISNEEIGEIYAGH